MLLPSLHFLLCSRDPAFFPCCSWNTTGLCLDGHSFFYSIHRVGPGGNLLKLWLAWHSAGITKVIPDPSPSKTTVPISSSKRTPRIQLSTDMSSFPTHFWCKDVLYFLPKRFQKWFNKQSCKIDCPSCPSSEQRTCQDSCSLQQV